jgi:translocation and assembly module TamB
VLLALGTVYTLRSNWFKEKVRLKIISAVEEASGGRVELGSFEYDWRNLTADLGNFVVHGTEPPGAPPLFRADSIHVGLRVLSFLKHDVDISFLAVNHPQIYLLVRADGSTNIPAPKVRRWSDRELVQELLRLKVRRFEFKNGAIQADLRRIPLNARGENLNAVIAYASARPRYEISVSSNALHLDSDLFHSISAGVSGKFELEKDSLLIRQLTFTGSGANIQASGTISHFAQPSADLQLNAQLKAADIARLANMPELRRGDFVVSGAAHYDSLTPLVFRGNLAGHKLAYQSHTLTLNDIDFQSNVLAGRREAKLTRLVIAAFGARLNGEAVWNSFRDFQLDGTMSGLALARAASFLTDKPLAWSGIANGRLAAKGTIFPRIRNLVVQTDLAIAPDSGGIPVSGNLDMTYRQSGGTIELGESHLHLPNTDLTISGTVGGNLQTELDSTNLNDLNPALALAGLAGKSAALPTLLRGGSAHFDGAIAGPLANPRLSGDVALAHFLFQGETWDQLRSRIDASAGGADFSSLSLDQGSLHVAGAGQIALTGWRISPSAAFRFNGQFKGADLAKIAPKYASENLPVTRGIASGSLDVAGSLNNPQGNARVTIDNLVAYGERFRHLELDASATGDQLHINHGRMQAGPAVASFSGAYQHAAGSWDRGDLRLKIDSNAFPLQTLAPIRRYEPGLNAQFEIHADLAARLAADRITPTAANGTVTVRDLTVNHVSYGSVTLTAATRGQLVETTFSGDLRQTHLAGSAQIQLTPGTPATGELHIDRMSIATLYALVNSGETAALPFDGFLQGGLTFEGPLKQLDKLRATVRLDQVELSSNVPLQSTAAIKPADLIFRNLSPIAIDASDGVATIRSFQIGGKDTSLRVTGSIPYAGKAQARLRVQGSVDMRIFQLFDPNVQSSGRSVVDASITGVLANPELNGTLAIRDGSFFLRDVTNGLSAVNGTVKFNRDRATIEKLTARSGGGELSLGGFVNFGPAGPLVYRLEGNAENVRVRYGSGISVTASSALHLSGTSENALLSGTITVSRVVLNPNTDLGNLLASISAPVASPSNEKAFISGLQLDVRIESAPNLQLSTALSQDVEAEIDLRLRGTPARPVLLGTVAANQGDIKVFGTKYSINRGQVSFLNPAKMEPALDLDLQTEARGITVDITISGTPSKLNINYRSDPPLQPRDIIALLTVGRAPNTTYNSPNVPATNDVTALQSGANTVLGQAMSPASNRLSKLFGITNIKIDPLVQGITNTPQARLTIEQQISRDITVTYVTNLSQTSEQIFRLEWALSRQYSLVALRDDNGEFGIDIQYKKQFK